jgi:putative hydrolase of the HAD superfamily
MTIRAVLWDADGVLQRLPGFDELWTFLPEDLRLRLLADIFGSEMPEVLLGHIDMAERVDRALAGHRLSAADAEGVRAVWSDFPAVEEAHAVLARLRAEGVLCVLATNQDTLRERHMRAVYDPLMDRCYYSCSMGVAKPDAAYFQHIAEDLGLAPGELLFIDDQADNVDAARGAGLHAERWHHDEGIAALEALLARHHVEGVS